MRIPSCVLPILLLAAARRLPADAVYSVTDLGSLGGGLSHGLAINEAGDVTGSSVTVSVYATSHAFLYSHGRMTDLGSLSSSDSEGSGINDAGQVTGRSVTPNGPAHAFLYSNGQMIDLGTFGGRYSSGADVNNTGEVTGA